MISTTVQIIEVPETLIGKTTDLVEHSIFVACGLKAAAQDKTSHGQMIHLAISEIYQVGQSCEI